MVDFQKLYGLLRIEEKLRGHPHLKMLYAKVQQELLAMAKGEEPEPAAEAEPVVDDEPESETRRV